jgi:YggT family protein
MFVLAYIIEGVGRILEMFLHIYMFLLLGRVIISWVDADPRNPIVQFLWRVTEPALKRVRRWFPFLTRLGGLDLTPLVIFAAIMFLQTALVKSLLALAASLEKM